MQMPASLLDQQPTNHIPRISTSSNNTNSNGSYSNTSTVLSYDDQSRLEIAVIESTLLVQDYDVKKKKRVRRVLTLFNIVIDDKHYNRSLVRYVPDFVEFDRKVRKYYRKSKITLPQIMEPDVQMYMPISQNKKRRTSFRTFFLRLGKLGQGIRRRPNSEKLEAYLQRCATDPVVGRSSLLRDFLSKQRPEDKIASKEMIQSYVDRQVALSNDAQRASMEEQQPSSSSIMSSSTTSSSFRHSDDYYAPRQSSSLSSPVAVEEDNPSHAAGEEEDNMMVDDDHHRRRVPTIQDYQFLKVLGKGCMGKVLLVRPYRAPNRLLALKAISKESVVVQREIEHTKMERDILTTIAQIRHPFLIRLHHAFQDSQQLFLVLDYHVGGDMATQLARCFKFPPERARLYAAEILLGLQELHRLGILYRDLKPENILLAADGHIVLTDFGLSKQFLITTADEMDEQKTRTFCGTAEYLAPEILRSEAYTYAVDFWSLGTILYEMLVGVTPFWHENHVEMYRRVLEDPLEFPEDFDDDDGGYTRHFIASLLERDPSRRLGSSPSTIRSHPYFTNYYDWSDVYHKRIRPPYVPQLRSATDFSNFDKDFLQMTPRLSPVSYVLSPSIQMQFDGYSFVNDSMVYSSDSVHTMSIMSNSNDGRHYNDNYDYYSDDSDIIRLDDYSNRTRRRQENSHAAADDDNQESFHDATSGSLSISSSSIESRYIIQGNNIRRITSR